MLAWRLYCRDPMNDLWRDEYTELERSERLQVAEWYARVHRGRQRGEPGEFALSKRAFVPVGRRQAARW
jgi:hypothetical protein